MTFGEIIYYHRKNNGWTVQHLIDKSKSSVSPAYISRIERQGTIPSPYFILKLADVFGIDHWKLLNVAKIEKIEANNKKLDLKYKCIKRW